jgi:hypothetical protein
MEVTEAISEEAAAVTVTMNVDAPSETRTTHADAHDLQVKTATTGQVADLDVTKKTDIAMVIENVRRNAIVRLLANERRARPLSQHNSLKMSVIGELSSSSNLPPVFEPRNSFNSSRRSAQSMKRRLSRIVSAVVARGEHLFSCRSGTMLMFHDSVGYVEFKNEESVQAAIQMTGQKLLGIPIIAQLTEAEKNRQARNPEASSGNHNSVPFHRLYVGNIHFSITETDLQNVFEPFGELEFVQLQKEEGGRSRGYGFVQ